MANVKVISSEKDGLELRREKADQKYYSRCKGLPVRPSKQGVSFKRFKKVMDDTGNFELAASESARAVAALPPPPNHGDEQEINEALDFSSREKAYYIPDGAWERIFGSKDK